MYFQCPTVFTNVSHFYFYFTNCSSFLTNTIYFDSQNSETLQKKPTFLPQVERYTQNTPPINLRPMSTFLAHYEEVVYLPVYRSHQQKELSKHLFGWSQPPFPSKSQEKICTRLSRTYFKICSFHMNMSPIQLLNMGHTAIFFTSKIWGLYPHNKTYSYIMRNVPIICVSSPYYGYTAYIIGTLTISSKYGLSCHNIMDLLPIL